MSIPFADAAKQDCLTEAQAKLFHEKGFLVVKNMVSEEELEVLRRETFDIIQQRNVGPDYWYNDEIPSDWYNNYKEGGQNTPQQTPNTQQDKDNNTNRKRGVPFRVEYVVDKMESCKHLSAHPFLLKSIAQIQGPDFIPTWDSLVFKYEGDGVPIKWHRDASSDSVGMLPLLLFLCFSLFLLFSFLLSLLYLGGGFYNYGTNQTKKGTYPPPIDAGISSI